LTSVAPPTVEEPGRRRWALDLGGAATAPLLILFGLNLVDEVDRVGFAVLSPEIRDAFHLGDGGIVAIGALSGLLILVGALPLGYLGDRYPRTRIAGIAGLVWGTCAALTGLSVVVPMLFLARLGSGAARTSNEVVHPSLLADYYSPEVLPRAFRIHRIASPLGYAAALVMGALGALVGWRLAFVVAAVPTFVLLLLLKTLPEPRRGGGTLAEDEPELPPLSFREARTALFGTKTLRRCWIGGFLLGVAFIANAQLLSLFFERVHGFDSFGRGVVQFVYGAGTVAGIVIGGWAAGRATARSRFHSLTYVIGGSFLISALALVGMAATPWSAVSVGLVFFLGVGLGVYQPAYFPLVARIVHPRIKTQAYGWTLLFAGLGGLGAIPLASIGEDHSYRLAFCLLAAIIAIGAAVVASSAGCVATDIARADAAD
jgi:branched-chain amino acid transport system ATP-binding protein